MSLHRGALAFMLGLASVTSRADPAPSGNTSLARAITYVHDRKPDVPLSIHVVRVPRRTAAFEIHSAHGAGRALGLATLSQQATGIAPELGVPMAAINGDFYQRQGSYTGDPRGLQIMETELISDPSGTPSFWIDAAGEPHTGTTESLLRVTWPDGRSVRIGLNEARRPNAIVLYTPALGASTHAKGGQELVLERSGDLPWLPLRAGKVYVARVREVRNFGNTPLTPETLVLSIGPGLATACPQLAVGAEIRISTETSPTLRGVKTAISGGPILVRGGKVQHLRVRDPDFYVFGSVGERHPRSAVGWNEDNIYFVEVDGRQKRVSIGMTLQELAAYMVRLGCSDAMNLDGGGSATLWYAGRVRNRPCDGHERLLANSLVAVQKRSTLGQKAKESAAWVPGAALNR